MTRYVIVTGGSSGIGKAVVDRLTTDGYAVINLDKKAPSRVSQDEIFVQTDLLDTDALIQAMGEIKRQYTVLRLINNAGMVAPGLLEDTRLEDMRAVACLNVEVPLLLTQQLVSMMKDHGFGRIVNISSRAALGKEQRSAYSASKAGLIGMSRTWALELAPHGITVNAIGPGPIATELFNNANPPEAEATQRILRSVPVKRLGQPAEVAHAAASFLDDRAGFITGQVLYVCGGMTVGLAHG